MKKMILFLCFLIVIAISGCAVEKEDSGGYERPSGHQGHRH
ncbi:MAG: hypothetical protein WC658_01940 [Candidatus Omnitrophota bacterium]